MKLTYFNGRGLAETSRVLFAIAGQGYEDFRYPIQVLDWATFKMERPEFDADKQSGKLWKSLDKLPFLEVDGEVVFQSKAIERYLATRFDLLGSTPLEAAFIDSIGETIRDFKDGYQKVRNSTAETKEAAMHTYFSETLPNLLLVLSNVIRSRRTYDNNDHYTFVIGNKLSLADVQIFLFLTDFFDNKDLVLAAYENLDILKAIVANVGSLDSVKKWLSTRPQTPF